VSTDYRDPRKAGFQEYVVASDFNAVRIPSSISPRAGSTVGVAYVAAALSLGLCMGVDFSTVLDGPDLSEIVRTIDPEQLPQDIRAECLSGINPGEGALPGDWLAIWGGMLSFTWLSVYAVANALFRIIGVGQYRGPARPPRRTQGRHSSQ
jgi:NADPH:quinone reductase-like Zn-dependent oxidoreductase